MVLLSCTRIRAKGKAANLIDALAPCRQQPRAEPSTAFKKLGAAGSKRSLTDCLEIVSPDTNPSSTAKTVKEMCDCPISSRAAVTSVSGVILRAVRSIHWVCRANSNNGSLSSAARKHSPKSKQAGGCCRVRFRARAGGLECRDGLRLLEQASFL